MTAYRRSDSRFSAGRLLIVITLVVVSVLVVQAVMRGKNNVRNQRAESLAFADSVRPFVVDSNDQAAALKQFRSSLVRGDGAAAADAPSVVEAGKQLKALAHDARKTSQGVADLKAPEDMRDFQSVLAASLILRSRALDDVAATFSDLSDKRTSSGHLPNIGSALSVSDTNYQAALDTLPSAIRNDVKMPPSKWLDHDTDWSASDMNALLAAWRSNAATGEVHDVRVLSYITDPAPVRAIATADGSVQVMPQKGNMTVTIVIANTGNQSEKRVNVKATIVAADSTSDAKNDTVNLKPGDRNTVTFRNIRVKPDGNSILTIDVTELSGERSTDDNHKVITFTMNPLTN